MSPTQRTLAALRKDGWTAEVVERWIPGANIRRDLFGFGDILAMHPDHGILMVQATSTPHVRDRIAKLLAVPTLLRWLQASPHNHVEVWGWAKRGARGKRKVFQCERRVLTLGALARCVEVRGAVEGG